MKNRVQLIGHVGQDPEIKNLENGKLANVSDKLYSVFHNGV